MREDQVDRIAQALENLAMNAGSIAGSQQLATQPTIWMTSTDETELTHVRARIETVGRTASALLACRQSQPKGTR